MHDDPERAWTTLLQVAATTDDAGHFWVGDIIEDLITAHGETLESRLVAELNTNAALRRAFVAVVPGHADAELEDCLIALRERIEAEDQS